MYYCIISLRDKDGPRGSQPPPLLRSSTLPAIIVPGLNILHAQIGPNSTPNGIVYELFNTIIVINVKAVFKEGSRGSEPSSQYFFQKYRIFKNKFYKKIL